MFGESAFRGLVLAAIKLNDAAKIPIDLYQKTQLLTDISFRQENDIFVFVCWKINVKS